ncbi:hypothetical protein M8818_001573 [Zalaria obscura]|uniref:Uncharacterized protein n=1 Tax=Zalaria obscura TaxID=2024903 RepID=A0ACC3SM59_9PEZI
MRTRAQCKGPQYDMPNVFMPPSCFKDRVGPGDHCEVCISRVKCRQELQIENISQAHGGCDRHPKIYVDLAICQWKHHVAHWHMQVEGQVTSISTCGIRLTRRTIVASKDVVGGEAYIGGRRCMRDSSVETPGYHEGSPADTASSRLQQSNAGGIASKRSVSVRAVITVTVTAGM